MNNEKLILNILGMNNFKQAIHKTHPNGYQTICGRNIKPKFIIGTSNDSHVTCKVCLSGGVSIHRLKQHQRERNFLFNLTEFARWLNENDYHPLGEWLWQKGIHVPDDKILTSEDLVIEYLKNPI